jgi:hypothetical protein
MAEEQADADGISSSFHETLRRMINDDDQTSDDDLLDPVKMLPRHQEEKQAPQILHNADGSVRKRNRVDYSRGPRNIKSKTPWTTCKWLLLLSDELTKVAGSRKAKEFRRESQKRLFW